MRAIFIFSMLFLFSCFAPQKPAGQNYHELIQKTIQQDGNYLNAFKKRTEKNWGDNWKLVGARIDTYESTEILKQGGGDKEIAIRDTNCILEWNRQNGSEGIIRRESYIIESGKPIGDPSVEIILYKNESIYAQGDLKFVQNGQLVFMKQIEYLKKKNSCKPCGDFSYKNYVDSMFYTGFYSEEFQFLDSLGNVECSYSSPKYMHWNYDESKNGIKAFVSSDTIVNVTGHCDFVELNEK